MTNSEFIIGPLCFKHNVQKISVNEQKAVEILKTTRSNKNFIVDSGESVQRAQVHMIFSGLDAINNGVRSLLALFRICPIISVKNELLSRTWKKPDVIYDEKNLKVVNDYVSGISNIIDTSTPNYDMAKDIVKNFSLYNKIITQQGKFRADIPNKTPVGAAASLIPFLIQNKTYSEYIPVAFENITVQSLEDMPKSFQVILTLARIDIESFIGPDLLYQGQYPQESSPDPRQAYWLKKWLSKVLDPTFTPPLFEGDFDNIQMEWYGHTLAGYNVEEESSSNIKRTVRQFSFSSDSKKKVLAESISISNYFGYHKIIGKGSPSVQHIGSSGRQYAIDIIFNGQINDQDFSDFCKMKEESDAIVRSLDRINRLGAWTVISPLTKLLSVLKIDATEIHGRYVPMSVQIETGDQPFVKIARMDMAETNLNYTDQKEATLVTGGTSVPELLDYFKTHIIPNEKLFRDLIVKSPAAASSMLIGQSTEEYQITPDAYRLFWPFTNKTNTFSKTELLGLLNTDTIRAAFLTEELKNTLRTLQIVTGKVLVGANNPGFFTRLGLNIDQFSEYLNSPIHPELYNTLIKLCRQYIHGLSEEEYNRLAMHLHYGYIGDIDSKFSMTTSSSKAVAMLSKSSASFSDSFVDRLFNTIVDRKPVPSSMPHIYSIEGVKAAFYKLSVDFILFLDKNPSHTFNKAVKKSSVGNLYSDLLLPSYIQLFGDEWTKFAPTYNDLGIQNLTTQQQLKQDSVNLNNIYSIQTGEQLQSEIAVLEDDIVDPHVFFFSTKFKPKLKEQAVASSRVGSTHFKGLGLSMPFNTKQMKRIEELLKNRTAENYHITNEALTEIIKPALIQYKTTRGEDFELDMEALRKANAAQFKDMVDTNGIKLYIHNNNNIVVPHRVTVPGLGGELYRIAKEALLLNKTDISELKPPSVVDVGYREASNISEIEYIRHLDQNTTSATLSMLAQIPDDYRSASKMFPAAKVYLIDRRGDEIFVDDILSSISHLLSIDITQDKDDPDLAVIKIADPLFVLQESIFPLHTTYDLNESGRNVRDRVYSSSRGDQSIERRKKIAQGRPIQIRMGYTSQAKNLPIIFTGKITEVAPGEILTIVAQSWKAELIGRQVAFVNKNPKDWGAKDLAVQTIQESSPMGMGDWIPQNNANYILQMLSKLDSVDLVSHILDTQADTDTVKGHRDLGDSIFNWGITSLGLRSLDKKDQGLDTRLKNIWYPDTIKYNNIFGWRSYFGWTPAFINDGWIVPLQPAWEVLKEASRHAWNCIVQVVPYDTESTIFFGHPDQPYFWTRGESAGKSRWRKYAEHVRKQNNILLSDVFRSFVDSGYYRTIDQDQYSYYKIAKPFYVAEELIKFIADNPTLTSAASYSDCVDLCNNLNVTYSKFFKDDIHRSGLPLAALRQLKGTLQANTIPVLLELYFNISNSKIQSQWPTAEHDIETLFSGGINTDTELAILESKIGSLGTNSYDIKLARQAVDTAFADSVGKAHVLDKIVGYTIPGVENSALSDIINYIDRLIATKPDEYTITKLSIFRNRFSNLKSMSIQEARKFLDLPDRTLPESVHAKYFSYINSMVDELSTAVPKPARALDLLANPSESLATALMNNLAEFKAFVYFFNLYLRETDTGRSFAYQFHNTYESELPPTMKSFRVIHYVDSDTDIIENNIVATTSEMWNTAVIEHPGQNEADNAIPAEDSLTIDNKYYSAIKWNYYPKQDVSGVIGLQFNPALTLANKKISIATELNCQSEELAAKLACQHLAEGIRRMYRGNLVIRGRILKPHDRIVLEDKYNQMSGPIEIESAIHHWNPSQGWITNIVPQAVCDANPGAAAIQTGIMEATYRKVFQTLSFAVDAANMALIIATIGGASITSTAGGSIIKSGIKNIAKELGEGVLLKNTGKRLYNGSMFLGKDVLLGSGLNPFAMLGKIWDKAGGLGTALAANWTAGGLVDVLSYVNFRLNIIPAFIDGATKAKQLPVILSPLIHNSIPFTAGLETDDAIYSIFMNGVFYSLRDIQIAAGALLDEFAGTDKVKI